MESVLEVSAWQLLVKSGPLIIPIIGCSMFAVAIVIEKFFYLASIKDNVTRLKEEVFDAVQKNHLKKAVKLCDESRSPVARILKAGVIQFGKSREDIKEAMEDASLFELPKLEQHLSALSTIANISPLIGLLGTVTGMTASFHTIQAQSTTMQPVTPGDLAGGIWEALLTTVAGLMVAIPAHVAHHYFVSRVNWHVIQMEHAATELLNFLCQLNDSKSED